MKKGITFGAFDLFHAGHVMMLEEAKTVCDHLIVCIQSDPSLDRKEKNKPVQSIVEREIQVYGCRYTDEVIIYDTEAELLEILDTVDWDVRILGEEYKNKDFTGREQTLNKCHFNKRPHNFSSSELRKRVAKEQFKKD
ncbi:MAG: adenylyltransferase/cytidyltransferase family protein [SAR86 cluster bacterium]|mgnify:FL=1|nr:adenylyltransferase/cytidyltransferase family protein [SAR86 cluster bacterium]|tara:strand:- start:60 stop:473 length:414 start_codon:yes stop_codon:yes gene_type:complete